MRSFVIQKAEAGQRLDKYLKRIMPEAPTSLLYKTLRKKNITLNGKKAEGKELLKAGDEVKIFFSDETFDKFSIGSGCQETNQEAVLYQKAYENNRQSVTVVYEDEDVLIADKPAGLLSQKAKPTDTSVNEWLLGYLLTNNSVSKESLRSFKPSVCNRLDRNTSGLVLCGKSLHGSQALGQVLKDRTLHKYYLTYVKGKFDKALTHRAYLIKNKKTNKVVVAEDKETLKQEASSDAVHDKNSLISEIETHITPLAYDAKHDVTKLEILLITGKSHQIRAHLSYLGYPILGDAKYGCKKDSLSFEIAGNFQMLHAYKVCFADDFALKDLQGRTITSQLPDSFEKLEKQLCLHGIPED